MSKNENNKYMNFEEENKTIQKLKKKLNQNYTVNEFKKPIPKNARGINIYFGGEKFIPFTPEDNRDVDLIKQTVKDFCEYHDISLNDFGYSFV